MSGTNTERDWDILSMDGWQDTALDDEALYWVMPEWLESYRHLISDTGGQSIEELMNDLKTGIRDNYMRAARVMAVNAQIELLYRLREDGLLVSDAVVPSSKAHQA